MNKTSWIVGVFCAILGTGNFAIAQTIVISPPAPSGGQTVIATFSEPFNCAAPQPELTAQSANSFSFSSTFSNGIVNCGIILSPAPVLSNFPISLGTLAPGIYEITWNIYKSQSQGDPVLLLTTSASVQVAAGDSTCRFLPDSRGTGTTRPTAAMDSASKCCRTT